ncbi:MAG: GNAT family N-acetyltransferase [Anaerolineae bacterium]
MPILETPRLILRRPEMEDAPAIYEHMQERDIAANTLLIPYPYPAGAAEEWISRTQQAYNDGEGYNFGVILKAEDRLIGAIGLGLRTDHRRAEMGYWLGKPYWGQGYMSEATSRLVAFAFEVLGLNRIHASAFTRNPASVRVLEKCGMSYEGTLRGHYFKWGEFVDTALYAITRDQYQTAHPLSGDWNIRTG